VKIIRAERGQGKTTELIKRSNKEWKYIVCVDMKRAKLIADMAYKMGLDIPYPLTVRELPLKQGQRIKSVLIDEVDDVLEYLIGRPVDCVTTSCEIEILKDWRTKNEIQNIQ